MEAPAVDRVVICDANIAIFLSMKAARLKKGRGKRDYFLLESVDSRISMAHEKVSAYRQGGIEVGLTRTILNEFNGNKLRRIVDISCSRFNFAQRAHIISQVLKKREDIVSRLTAFDIKGDDIRDIVKHVTGFYSDPEKKDALEGLQKKKGRRDLLPELNDRIILAECCFLGNGRDVTLLTDDSDFTEFSEGIQKAFGVNVESLM